MNLEESVWLACAIDTDGHVGIKHQKQVRKTQYGIYYYNYYLPQIGFGNTHKGITERFACLIDAKVSRSSPPAKKEWKRKYNTVTFDTIKIKTILEEIIPYLIVKQERGKLVLEFCNYRLSNPGDHSTKTTRNDRGWYEKYHNLLSIHGNN